MIVTTRQHTDRKDSNICIKGDKLQVVESERLLGIQVDNFLTRNAYIQNTHNTIAGTFAFLCKIKNTFHIKQRKRSTTAMFYHIWTTVAPSGARHTHQSQPE